MCVALEPVETPAAVSQKPLREATWLCPRCDSDHAGLCARLGRGALAVALRRVGLSAAWSDSETHAGLRQRSCDVVRGIVTKTGRDRELAIATCGRPVLALVDGEIQLLPLYCRDRMCAGCQKRRSRKLGKELREFIGARAALLGDVHNMVTLTQPKPPGDDPEPPLKSIRGYWRRMSNTKTARGREFHRRFPGGLRSIEITWSERGDRRRDGSTVPYSGWHAHLHLGVQCTGPDGGYEDMRWLVREWCAMTGGRADAQHWAPLDDDRIGQLAMYIVKPLGDAHKDRDIERRQRRLDRARELARRLHAKRLHEGWGAWKGWRKSLDEREPSVVAFAINADTGESLSLVDLVALATDRATAHDTSVEWQVPGDHGTVTGHTAAVVLREVTRWCASERKRSDQAREARDARAAVRARRARPPP